mmetsp:Transcript_59888/g.175032  ORF Transcript_59888/g.175032 Transcript_59888/m.175032 type:complete len:526 (+) Transcript_59888:69-1646(+)
MGALACCCLGCGGQAAVAPEEGVQPTWSGRVRSRDAQALEFVNVCAGAAGQGQLEATQQKASSTMVHFFTQVVTVGIVCPTLYFCVLLPLQLDGLPAWCWGFYYWTCMMVGASVFAQYNISASIGAAPHWGASLCVLTTMIVVVAGLAIEESSSTGGMVGAMAGDILCFLACIYWPSFHRVCHCAWRERACLKESLFYLAGMMLGAVPCATATAAYVLVSHFGWADDARLVVLLLVIWSALPIVIKFTGKHLFIHGAPACRGLAPVLWVQYIEVAFACLGLGIFNNATSSAAAYALSFAALLVLQIARGSQLVYRWLPCMNSLSLHRLVIFLEMLAAFNGRVTSYTLFLCFSILKLARGEEQRQTLVSDTHTFTPGKINLYADQGINIASVWTGLLGLAIVISIFIGFVYLLPMFWAFEAHGQCEDSEATGESRQGPPPGPRHEACPTHNAESAGTSMALGQSCSWIQETEFVPTHAMQYNLLLGFMVKYRFLLISTLVFIFGMCILLVDLASRIGSVLQGRGNQ